MTDKEILIDMFKRNDIKYHLKDSSEYYKYYDIQLDAGSTGVTGYVGFFTTFDFDEDGNLKTVGVYE